MAYKFNPGNLRHRITIQQISSTQDDYGQPIDEWTDIATVWASIEPITGREFFAADTINSEISHRIRMRYKPGILPSMRVKFKTRYFDIQSVINYNELNTDLQLMCKELV